MSDTISSTPESHAIKDSFCLGRSIVAPITLKDNYFLLEKNIVLKNCMDYGII